MLIIYLFLLARVNFLPVFGLPHFADDFPGGELGRVVFGARQLSGADKDHSLTAGKVGGTEGVPLTSVNSHKPNPQSSSVGPYEEAVTSNAGPPLAIDSSGDWRENWYTIDHPFLMNELADLQRIWFGEPSTSTHTSEAEVAFQSLYDHSQIGRCEQPPDFLPPQVSVQPHSTWEPLASPPHERHWPSEGSPSGYGNPRFTYAEDTHPPQMISQAFSSASSALQPISAPAFHEASDVALESGHAPKAKKRRVPKRISRPRISLYGEERILHNYHMAQLQAGWVPQQLVYDQHWLDRLNDQIKQLGDTKTRGPFFTLSQLLPKLLKDSRTQGARFYLLEKDASRFFVGNFKKFWSSIATFGHAHRKARSLESTTSREPRSQLNLYILDRLRLPKNIQKFQTYLGLEPFMKEVKNSPIPPESVLLANQMPSRTQTARILEIRRLFLAFACMINTFFVREEFSQEHVAYKQTITAFYFDSLFGFQHETKNELQTLRVHGPTGETQEILAHFGKWIREDGMNASSKITNTWRLVEAWLVEYHPTLGKAMNDSQNFFKSFFRYLLLIELELW